VPTHRHPVPSRGHGPGTAPRGRGPYRLPGKADPWGSRLPRGPRLAGQPLGSHEARVTLEGKAGCQCQRRCCVPPPSHAQSAHLPSAPWVPPRRSPRAGPAGRGRGVKAPQAQHRARHGDAWSSSRTPRPRGMPQGCPGDAPGPPITTHIAPRAPRLALQSPVAFLTLLALRDRRTAPTPSPSATHVGTGRSWQLCRHPGTPGAVVPAAMLGPTGGLDSPSARRRRPPLGPPAWEQHGGCPWVGSCRGSLLPPPPPLLSSHPAGSSRPDPHAPAQGTHETREGGDHGWVPVPQPPAPSITHRLSTLPLLAPRPLGALGRRRRREWGEGGWQSPEGARGGVGGVSPARGRRGGCARSQRPVGGGDVAQGLCLHPPWLGMGGRGGQERSPGQRDPPEPGTPTGSTLRAVGSLPGTRPGTLTRSPFSPLLPAVPGRPRSPFPPCERGEVWVTRRGCPHDHTCAPQQAPGSRAGMLWAQPRVCVATSLPEPGSAFRGGGGGG